MKKNMKNDGIKVSKIVMAALLLINAFVEVGNNPRIYQAENEYKSQGTG